MKPKQVTITLVLLFGCVLAGCSAKRWADIEPGEYVPLRGRGPSSQVAVQVIQAMKIDRDRGAAVFTLADGSELAASFVPRGSEEWPAGCPSNIASTYMEVLDIQQEALTIGSLTFRDPILVRNCPSDPVEVALREDGEIGGAGTACTGSDECVLFGIPSAFAPPTEPPTIARSAHTPTSLRYPVRVACVALPDIMQDIYVAADYAYVAGGESGLRLVMNISDPANPVGIG